MTRANTQPTIESVLFKGHMEDLNDTRHCFLFPFLIADSPLSLVNNFVVVFKSSLSDLVAEVRLLHPLPNFEDKSRIALCRQCVLCDCPVKILSAKLLQDVIFARQHCLLRDHRVLDFVNESPELIGHLFRVSVHPKEISKPSHFTGVLGRKNKEPINPQCGQADVPHV